MSMWRVEFDRNGCIGAGACAAANANFWTIEKDGRATLKTSTFDEKKKIWVLHVSDAKELQKHRDAANVCPVNVIHIYSPDGKQEI